MGTQKAGQTDTTAVPMILLLPLPLSRHSPSTPLLHLLPRYLTRKLYCSLRAHI